MTDQYRYGVTRRKTQEATLYVWAEDGFDAARKAEQIPSEQWAWSEPSERHAGSFVPGAGGPVGNRDEEPLEIGEQAD